MQAGKSDDDLKARAAVYAARLLSGQARRGKKYREVKRVYQIFFLDNILFPGSGKVPRRYALREEREHDQLSETAEIVFYELPKLEGEIRKYLAGTGEAAGLSGEQKWCIYIKYREEERAAGLIAALARGEEGIMNAERALQKMNREREQWARALWREKKAMDYLDYKTRLEEALAEGLEKGKAEGLEQGREEGKAEARFEAARRMKDMGIPLDKIAAGLGLSPEDMEAL